MEPASTPPEVANRARTLRLWFEIAAVACIGVLPALISTLRWSWAGAASAEQGGFLGSQAVHAAQSLCIIVPVMWIILHSDAPLERFGLVPLRPAPDAGAAIVAGVGYWAAAIVAGYAIVGLYYLSPDLWQALQVGEAPAATAEFQLRPVTANDWIVFSVSSGLNGLAEELVCRAYLFTRLTTALRSPLKGLLLSSALFASYHLYQGLPAAIAVFFGGIVFALVFQWRRSLWPVAVGHAALDVVLWVI